LNVVFLVGRLLFVYLFVESGFMNLIAKREQIEQAEGKDVPEPELAVRAAGTLAVVGGISIALGLWGDVGAVAVATFLVGVTPVMHAYWRETEAPRKRAQRINFMKNVGLLGGALVLFYTWNQLQGDAGLSLTDPLFPRW
jgi:putative oxidoreductase